MEDYAMLNEKWARPQSSFQKYRETAHESIAGFLEGNAVISMIEKGDFGMQNYHSLLKAVFHQVYFSSTSFAMAGAMASLQSVPIRTYLMHHAEEEMNHWIWILEDLKSTGYTGPDPRTEFPNWAAQAYLSYGVQLAMFKPVGRLAMAQVLEGISGNFGIKYGMKALGDLKLKKEQAKFFLVHGELDQGHAQEIDQVLEQAGLNSEEWAELENIARVTSRLYKNLYNYSFESLQNPPR